MAKRTLDLQARSFQGFEVSPQSVFPIFRASSRNYSGFRAVTLFPLQIQGSPICHALPRNHASPGTVSFLYAREVVQGQCVGQKIGRRVGGSSMAWRIIFPVATVRLMHPARTCRECLPAPFQSCRIASLSGRQFNHSAVTPDIDRQPKAGVFLDSFRHCNLKSDFGPLFEWQPQHTS